MNTSRGIKNIQEPRNGIQFVVYPETREELKPIVFFDAGKFTRNDDGFTIGYHPHSGIGIVTYFHGTDLHHKDSGHNNGIIPDGGAQWIQAGGGVWHEEGYHRKAGTNDGSWEGSIHQLWLQLPPEKEEAAVEYLNLNKEQLHVVDNVRVLIGNYQGVEGQIRVPVNMTYLDIHLNKGETWSFESPAGQTTGFLYPRDGSIQVQGRTVPNQLMGMLDHQEGTIEVTTNEDEAQFVLIIAEPSQHALVTAGGSIHTNSAAMARSAGRIQEIRKTLL